MNYYAQRLAELQSHADHELKEIGDQWQTPKPLAFGLFWHFAPKIGPVVLDLFADDCNHLAGNYYTAEINAFTQDWSGDLKRLGGAAFGNPPYSRHCSDEDGTPITGIENVLQYCREQREQGAKIILLLKAATSDGWWPEDADFIQFISGRIGFQTPDWYVPRDPKKDKPSSSGFASAVIIFDKEWQWERRPTERLSRHLLETQGQIIINMIESRANIIVAEREQAALQVMQIIPTQIEETSDIEPVSQDTDSPIAEECEPVAVQLDDIGQAEADAPADDNYQLPFVTEPENDYSDKTIEQIYAMDDESDKLLRIIMMTFLFGRKDAYTHREVQFALSSILTEGSATNAQHQYQNSLAIALAMTEFFRKHDATVRQQHDLIYAVFILSLCPAKEPLYQNVKLLIQVNDIYSRNNDINATIEALENDSNTDDSMVVDLTDVSDVQTFSVEWLKDRCMEIDHFTEFSDEQKEESVSKIIQAAGDINDEFNNNSLAPRAENVISEFIAVNPTAQTLLNIRSLRAQFRTLVQASIKEVANG